MPDGSFFPSNMFNSSPPSLKAIPSNACGLFTASMSVIRVVAIVIDSFYMSVAPGNLAATKSVTATPSGDFT